MHLELVSLLRCPNIQANVHADGWLVASVSTAHERYIEEGVLGCPTCGAEYAVRGGVTYMADEQRDAESTSVAATAHRASALAVQANSESASVNLAAMLGIADTDGTYALVGHGMDDAFGLQALVPVRCLAINPTDGISRTTRHAPLGVIVAAQGIPVAQGQLSGVSLVSAPPTFVESAVRALKQGGRLIAPVSVPLPEHVTELARDETHWVAERAPRASAPVVLARR